MKRILLFDLDGTLTDPALGITNGFRYALSKMGVSPPPREALYPFIGPPIDVSFGTFFPNDKSSDAPFGNPTKVAEAVAHYRTYYREKGLFENRVYDGIPEALRTLQNRGYTLALATSKPEEFARRIMIHFGLDRYFALLGGASFDTSRSQKRQVIAYVLERLSASPQDCVMIGDRIYDMEGAAAFPMDALGVLWGYGPAEEFRGYPTVSSPSELAAYFPGEPETDQGL